MTIMSGSGRVLKNRYRLGKTLGEGAQGKVKIALDLQHNTQVAIKMMEGKNLARERFWREIQLLRALVHPNVIRLHDAFEDGSTVCMVLELGQGDLFDFLEVEKSVPETVARAVFTQLIAGIKYCHEHNIVHRDIKPENLLVNGDLAHGGILKICDFGLANAINGSEGARNLSTLCGSESYAAPEIFNNGGAGYIPGPVDVWSSAMILYNLVTGFNPWVRAVRGDDTYRRFTENHAGFWRWTRQYAPRELSDPLVALLDRMLDPNPLTRATLAEVEASEWHGPAAPVSAAGYGAPEQSFVIEVAVGDRAAAQNSDLSAGQDGSFGHLDADDEPVYRDVGPSFDPAESCGPHGIASGGHMDQKAMLESRTAKNCLHSGCDLSTLFGRVQAAAAAIGLDGGSVVVDHDKYKITGPVPASEKFPAPLVVSIKVIPSESFEPLSHTIRMKRKGAGKGDYFQWRHVFGEFKASLQDCLI